MQTKKTTIYDIAQKSGFSPTTVSRVLSGSDYQVNKQTRNMIENLAKEMNYTNAFLEKKLQKNCSDEIGIMIPNISNYYYTSLLQGIQHVVSGNGCHILLADSLRNREIEAENTMHLIRKKVKGILIASIDSKGGSVKKIIESGIPVVAMEQRVGLTCITATFNFFKGAQLAVEHLIERGHKKIAFISPPLTRSSRQELFEGYRATMTRYLSIDERYVSISKDESNATSNSSGLMEFDVGKEAVDALMSLTDPPTAVFCVNDLIAIGALRQLAMLNIKTPERVAVVGFDNIIFSTVTTPSLTTIDQSAFNLGQAAATLLFNKIANPDLEEKMSVLIEPTLVVREST